MRIHTHPNPIRRSAFWRRKIYFCVCILSWLGITPFAYAGLDKALSDTGWQEIEFDDKQPNHFSLVLGDNALSPSLSEQHIKLVSNNSVSVAYYPFKSQPVHLDATPYLNFSWQYSGDKMDTDISKKGGDDRQLSVYIAFAYQPKQASFKERLSRPLIEGIHGKDTPGRVISYLWAGQPQANQWIENPYTGKAGFMKIISDLSAPQKQWIDHKVNVRQDFEQLFGFAPGKLLYIAISADTDDTRSQLTAEVKNIHFSSD